MTQAKSSRPGNRAVARKAHWIEWATGIVCTLIVTAMTLWIAVDAITASDGTPELTVHVTHQQQRDDGYEVMFSVENTGSRTAASVPVTGTLQNGDSVIESHQVTFDYVPAESEVSGVLIFAKDPATATLDLRTSGYIDP